MDGHLRLCAGWGDSVGWYAARVPVSTLEVTMGDDDLRRSSRCGAGEASMLVMMRLCQL